MRLDDVEILQGKLRLKHALYTRLQLSAPAQPSVAQQNALDDARASVASLQRIIYWMDAGSNR